MLITNKEIISSIRGEERNWLHECLLGSLTKEAMDSGLQKDGDYFFDVKLLVNEIEVEPKLLHDLISEIYKVIERNAIRIAEEKLRDSLSRADKLSSMIDEACQKIRDEFKLENPEDYE